MIGDILQSFVPDYGICAFADVRAHLLPCRAAARLPADARSVIMMIFPYQFSENGARDLSRYACVPDYHQAAGAVLAAAGAACRAAYPDYQFEPFTDNSPIPEVRAAALAGLGVIGDHGLLIHPQYGSFVFLGELVTDLPLTPTAAAPQFCLHCGACASACPGGCLPGSEREGCLSRLTQKKGVLSAEETAKIRQNGLVWGCDTCQDVCPLNREVCIRPHPCFTAYSPRYLPNDAQFSTRAYAWRGEAVPQRNYRILYSEED